MTGPWHYREAERLLAGVPELLRGPAPATHETALAAAQVHATLALAAATADLCTGRTDEESQAWAAALTTGGTQ